MALITPTPFKSPFIQFNGHLQTIIPNYLRNSAPLNYTRERVSLPDGDFIDVDWYQKGCKRAIILSHGLEGESKASYMNGMAELFANNGWDVIAWNFRSCSGDINLLPRLYSQAEIQEIETTVNKVLSKDYEKIGLIGFSLGGNVTLSFMGKKGDTLDERIIGAMAISAPVDINGCVDELTKPTKQIYNQRFVKSLKEKVYQRNQLHPEMMSTKAFEQGIVKGVRTFDRHYTARWYGFESENEYYAAATPLPYAHNIARPSLLLNAVNDPFLNSGCIPVELAKDSAFFHLEVTKNGGHVGFMEVGQKTSYAERRALNYMNELYLQS